MQTMAFTVLSFSQLLLVMELRFDRVSAFNFKMMIQNLPIHYAFYVSAGILPIALYTEWGQVFFKTVALSREQLLTCLGISMIIVIIKECEKFLRKVGILH